MSALLRLVALDSLRGGVVSRGAGGTSGLLLANATENGRRLSVAAAAAAQRQASASSGKEDGSSFTSEDEEGFSASSSSELPPPPPPSAGVTVAAMGMGGKKERYLLYFSWFSPFPTSLKKMLLPSLSLCRSLISSNLSSFQQQLSAPSPWPSWESSACSRWPGPWRGARAGRWWRRKAEAEAEAEAEERAARAARARASSARETLSPCFFCPRLASLSPCWGLFCNAMKRD